MARKRKKNVGRQQGRLYPSRKSVAAKKFILEHAKDFGGTMRESELMEACGISRNSLYKYKHELRYGVDVNRFRGSFTFLSNFTRCDLEYQGYTYPSVEAAYQAQKCLPDHTDQMSLFFNCKDGKTAKAIGEQITLSPDWDDRKVKVMRELLEIKFHQEKFKALLLDTKEGTLCEGNTWHDNFWGKCYCDKCKDIPKQNMLGKMLMEIRAELQGEDK